MNDDVPTHLALLQQVDRITAEVERLRILLSPPDEPSCLVHGQTEWKPSMIRWLAAAIEHLEHLAHAIDYLAEHPDEAVSIETLYEQFGTDRDQLGNELGRMSRLVKDQYGFRAYPFRAWQAGSDNKMRYQMPHVIAGWWMDARAGRQT